MEHIPVLLNETIEALEIKDKAVVFDGTLGGGGHALEIAKRYPNISLYMGCDLDQDAISRVEKKFTDINIPHKFFNTNFRDVKKLVVGSGLMHIDSAMFDLGISSFQLEEAGRGFSFMRDEPLQMTMRKGDSKDMLTAEDIVNTLDADQIANILFNYGDERYSRRIARAIVDARKEKPITTSIELAKIIEEAVPKGWKKKGIHPATKSFQAIRIAVNDELESIEEGVKDAFEILSVGGRIAVISFHSLEDRIIKHLFQNLAKEGRAKIIFKKPVPPSKDEIKNNPRSRSAKLRVIEKIV